MEMFSHNQYLENGTEAHLPPGFRFHPTDEELITYYLLKKVLDSNFTGRAIAEVDLNKCEPWELPGQLLCFIVCIILPNSIIADQALNVSIYIYL